MKPFLPLLFVVLILLSGCEETTNPVSQFSFQNNLNAIVDTETFGMGTDDVCTLVNESKDAAVYLWDFGDGRTSSDMSPQVSYENSGTYTVTLTATSPTGEKSSLSKTIVVKERVLKFITIDRVHWDTNNSNGWPTSPKADLFLQIKMFTDLQTAPNFTYPNCPVIFTSEKITNVNHQTYTSRKPLIQTALPEHLGNAYLFSINAEDEDGNLYCIQNNTGGGSYFGILKEDFSANEFIVQNGPFASYTLHCEFE
jgi:hypothetical protein